MSLKMRASIVGLLLVFGPLSIAFCQEPVWKQVLDIEERRANLVGFNNEKHGITVGYAGAVWFTKDSGQTWTKGVNISACRFGLDILDDLTAFNCGNVSSMRFTVDGGRNWDKMADFDTTEANHFRFLSFIDDKTGWLGAPTILAATTDRGASWKELRKPDGMGRIAAIELVMGSNGNAGFVLDSNGTLYATADGGAAWSAKPIVVQGSKFNFTPNDAPANAMQFKNPMEGVVIAYRTEPKKGWVALSTGDAGATWKAEEITEAMDPASAAFISNDGVYVTLYFPKVISVFKRGS
jgi:photosystem II stability/assembly factor-like uncharacterized protein